MSHAQSLVFQALLRAARCDGPARLIESAVRPNGFGLFPASGASEAIAAAVPHWLREEPRLANQPRQVRLTEAGAEVLLERTPPGERCALVWSASALYQRMLLNRWRSLQGRHGSGEELAEWQRCAERLSEDFRVPGQEENGRHTELQRHLAQELVLSWKHARNLEVREGIARAMRGAGLRPIGVPGEQVVFVGRLHGSAEPLFPGDAAVVIEPGWMIQDGSGDYLLEKALVAPV